MRGSGGKNRQGRILWGCRERGKRREGLEGLVWTQYPPRSPGLSNGASNMRHI